MNQPSISRQVFVVRHLRPYCREKEKETAREIKKSGDRRVKYTKAILRETLIDLLQEQPIDKISVKEICVRADINRSTFYTHYADVFDLLHQIENDTLNDLSAYLSGLNDIENEAESLEILTRIFEYIIENQAFCKVLLGEHGDTEFLKEILMIVQRHTLKEWANRMLVDTETLEYSMIFSVHGSIGVIRQWLRNSLDKSAAEISDVIMSLTSRGFSRYIRT